MEKYAADEPKLETSMTEDERKEWMYRRDERLGILCEDRIPTLDQRTIALMDANKWLEAIRTQYANEQSAGN